VGVALREQAGDRYRGDPRIGDVATDVGVGQLLGLDHDVQTAGGARSPLGEREALHQVEHQQRADPLRRRRQLPDRPAAIGRGDRLDPLGGERRQVGGGHPAAVSPGEAQDPGADLALVEGVSAVGGELPVRPRQVGIAEQLADPRRPAVEQERAGGHRVATEEVFALRPQAAHQLGDREAVLGQTDRRRQQLGERPPAEPLEELRPAVHGAGNGDREHPAVRHAADPARAQRLDGEPGRRPAAGVQAEQLALPRVVDQGEQVAADAVAHRRHQARHCVGGDRGVDGVAAARQDHGAGLRRQRMLRRDDAAPGDHHGPRLGAVLLAEAVPRDQRQDDGQHAGCLHRVLRVRPYTRPECRITE
jgi:hypothetical protein